ncbi:hypothetical protein C8R45DRAFT_938653 [Mycena sanguinolenta]|nr:hypothetical protein C8R45DRAFT_938653 [Mycena sanguinolenta]
MTGTMRVGDTLVRRIPDPIPYKPAAIILPIGTTALAVRIYLVLGSVFAATQTRLSSSEQSRENEEDGTDDQFGRILSLRELHDTHFCPNFDRSLQRIRARDLNRTRRDSVAGIAFLLFPVNCKKCESVDGGKARKSRDPIYLETNSPQTTVIPNQSKKSFPTGRERTTHPEALLASPIGHGRATTYAKVSKRHDADLAPRGRIKMTEKAESGDGMGHIPAPNATLPLPGLEAAPVEDGGCGATGPIHTTRNRRPPPDGRESGDTTVTCSSSVVRRAGGRAGWNLERLGAIVKREWEGTLPGDAIDKEGKDTRLDGNSNASLRTLDEKDILQAGGGI